MKYSLDTDLFLEQEEQLEQDYDRMRRLMPDCCRILFAKIEDVCDRLEYEESFLFDESPDKTTLFHLTDRIADDLPDGPHPSIRDLIQTMLCDEMLYRRNRRSRRKNLFPR